MAHRGGWLQVGQNNRKGGVRYGVEGVLRDAEGARGGQGDGSRERHT